MFNRGAFNLAPYNRQATVAVFGSFVMDLNCDITMQASVEMYSGFDMDLSTEMIFEAIREQLGAFILEATGDLDFNSVRERTGHFEVVGTLDVSFSAGRYHVDSIEFVGNFRPGDKIVIDSNSLKLTLNGQNALHLMQGDFFDLNTGANTITYTDDQSGRTVRIRITHRDKFV